MTSRRTLLQAALAPAPPASEHTLFAFDDQAIPWHDNLRLTLVPAEKHPSNPVLRAGPAGATDHGHAILYGTVLHEGGKFRMWYLGMQEDNFQAWARSRWRPMCYAESTDGVRWTKPNLGLVRDNICLIEAAQPELSRIDDFLSIIHDPADPDPSRRYKCVYIVHPPVETVKGGLRDVGEKAARFAMMMTAVSADGLRWKALGDRPAVNAKFEVSGLYRFGSFYYAAGQQISPWAWRNDGREIGRVGRVFRSADFVNWSSASAASFERPGQTTAQPAPGQQTHMGAGLWNRGNVLVGLYGMWQDGPASRPPGAGNLWGTHIDLGLVLSNDGIRFREPVPDFKVIARGGPGEWDDIALLQGHAFANVNDRTFIWYSHWDTGGKLKDMHIGLATLRRDGFGYLSAHRSASPAHCVTASVPVRGRRLSVNVTGVSAGAPMVIDLLDDAGRPVPGFSARITTEGVRVAAAWPRALPPLETGALRIHFPAGARLYAAYLERA